jgi:hypothetical protein
MCASATMHYGTRESARIKFVSIEATKAHMESGDIAPFILRHLKKMSAQPYAPAVLLSDKESPIPIKYKAGWTPKPVCKFWSRGKIISPCRDTKSRSPGP